MLYICVRTYADGKYINMVFLPRIFTNYHECIEMCIDLQQKLGQDPMNVGFLFHCIKKIETRILQVLICKKQIKNNQGGIVLC